MRIVITSGPSYESLDEVRRLTNSSTGELGTLLAETLAEAGHRVVLYRGVGSTYPAPLWPVETHRFTTSSHLETLLQQLPSPETVSAFFHIAALNDFRISEMRNEQGELVSSEKFSSRAGKLYLTLEPVPKLIAHLRSYFPTSLLIGWKLEMAGTLAELVAKGQWQMEENLTDACVLNGQAYGQGFGVLSRSGERVHLPDKPALCLFLREWLERIPGAQIGKGAESFHALATLMPLAPFL